MLSLCFPCAAYGIRHSLDLALLTNQNGRYFYRTHLATLVCTLWRNWRGDGGETPPWQAKCKNWIPSSWHSVFFWFSVGFCIFFGVFSFFLDCIDTHHIRIHYHFLTFFWVLASSPLTVALGPFQLSFAFPGSNV